MNYNFQSGIAKEKLKNNSVCIKEGLYIRNIGDYMEIDTETFVMVCNIQVPFDYDEYIKEGEMVRYFKLPM